VAVGAQAGADDLAEVVDVFGDRVGDGAAEIAEIDHAAGGGPEDRGVGAGVQVDFVGAGDIAVVGDGVGGAGARADGNRELSCRTRPIAEGSGGAAGDGGAGDVAGVGDVVGVALGGAGER